MKNQRGFTLVEVMISMVLLAMFAMFMSVNIKDLVDTQQGHDNDIRIVDLSKKIEGHYRQNAWNVESESANKYYVGGTSFILNGEYTSSSNPAWVLLARQIGLSERDYVDGYNRPYKILISPRLTYNYEGILIPYRTIAFVSNNGGDVTSGNQVILSTLDANGTINLANRESASVFNSLEISTANFIETREKVRSIASLYTQYYWGKVNNGKNDASVNYFAGGTGSPMTGVNWDSASTIKPTCASDPTMVIDLDSAGVPITKTNLDKVLGLSKNMITTAWGTEIGTLNCNNATFKTGGVNVVYWTFSKNKLPFTALLGFALPNLDSYVVSVYSTN